MIQLREGEKVYEIKRRHKIILILDLLIVFIIALLTLITMIIVSFVPFSFPEQLINFIPGLVEVRLKFFTLFYLSLILVICWQIIFISFSGYYLDTWIVTNQRTIHTELRSFFNRIVSSVPHNKIQDVTVDVNGFLPTIFKYGNLQIQTAGKFQEFIFKQIPDPYQTKEIIYRAKEEDEINKSLINTSESI